MRRASTLPEGYRIPDDDSALLAECEVQVFRSSGPGGQSVNTTDSAVRLVHGPTGIRVQCQRERSQLRNKHICLARLRERLEALKAAQDAPARVATHPSRAEKQRRLATKARVSAKKRMRRLPAEED